MASFRSARISRALKRIFRRCDARCLKPSAMLVKGSARGGAADLARHLQRTDQNERVTLIEIHGLAARDLDGALLEMDALGADLKTRRTLYHMSINPERGKDREMSYAEWDFAVQAARKKMGLEN